MSTRSATCVLRFPLQLVEVLGAAIADKVRVGLKWNGSTPLAEKVPSNICTRCSRCSTREYSGLFHRCSVQVPGLSSAHELVCQRCERVLAHLTAL